MQLLPGKRSISHNIEEMEAHGHPRDQSIAAALNVARRHRAEGGSADDGDDALKIARAVSANPDQRGARELGFSGPWYHGTERLDRLVGNRRINPKRATSGPMPFFTDDPQMASNYAKSKPDTSRVAQDTGNVGDYFTVAPRDLGLSGRSPLSVERSWYFLSPEKRKEIAEKALRIGHQDPDTGDGPIVLHPPGVNGSPAGQSTYDHMLKEARGNHLAALRDLWHDSGYLVGQEPKLAEIYKLAGYSAPISQENAPWTSANGVFPAMLRTRNPLDTSNHDYLLSHVVPHLESAFKHDRTRKQQYGVDQWDKNVHFTPREWTQQLKEDAAAKSNSGVWTSIPDKVTAQLAALGHDSIVDTGANLGAQATMWRYHSGRIR